MSNDVDQTRVERRIREGREVVEIEIAGLQRTAEVIDRSFSEAIDMMASMRGKVVLSGVGKSGLIARKIAATLNSTGTPAVWVSPVDALHGDLGLFQTGDVALLFSKSGRSEELSELLRALSGRDLRTILMTAEDQSRLAHRVDLVLPIRADREACPLDLAPTTSTTCMLALGDALSVVLMRERGFEREDFAVNHPSGALGRRLTMRLGDVMRQGEEIPCVEQDTPFHGVVLEISRKRLGATLVSDRRRLVGIVTDGDLRRAFERGGDTRELTAADIMTPRPMSTTGETSAIEGLRMLEKTRRAHLPIVDADGGIHGIVHLHDLVEAGL